MLKKITILLTIFAVSVCAQNYKSDNYMQWRILGKSVEDKYLIVQAKDQKMVDRFRPICVGADKWIFRYEMMAFDDAFYNAQSKPSNLKFLKNSADYIMKIDIEEDNIYSEKTSADKICTENQTQLNINPQAGKVRIGIVTYVGDKNIGLPF